MKSIREKKVSVVGGGGKRYKSVLSSQEDYMNIFYVAAAAGPLIRDDRAAD